MQIRLYAVLTAVSLALLCCFCNFGCKHERDYSDIPYIYTDTTIDVTSAMYHFLESPTGWGYIPSGYKGIFIYNISGKEFVALERCCTYDPNIEEARVDYIDGILKDSVCGSVFYPWDGSVRVGSPAELPLRQYQTQYFEVGASKRLRIYNR